MKILKTLKNRTLGCINVVWPIVLFVAVLGLITTASHSAADKLTPCLMKVVRLIIRSGM